MNSKISKYYDYISTGLLTLIAFFCLAFSLIKGGGGDFAELGFGGISANGFNYISFTSEGWLAYLTGAMCILQLGVCVFMTIYFIKILCTGEKEGDKKLFFIFNIVFLCFLFVYFVLGVLFVAFDGVGYTLAYIPLLLGVFVFIFYFLQKKVNGESFSKAPAKASAKKAEEKPALKAEVKAEVKPAAKPEVKPAAKAEDKPAKNK